MPSADFLVNGSACPPEKAVSASSTVTLALLNVAFRTVEWSIVSRSPVSLSIPTITPGGTPLGSTATFDVPSGTGQSYLVQCIVNGGRDDAGVAQSALTKRAVVGVLNSTGIVPVAPGEEYERDATQGWADDVNDALDVGGTGSIADDAITFAKMQNIGVGLIGNDTGTADPKLITLAASLAFSGGALGVATNGVALSQMAQVSTARILGRVTASTGNVESLTGTQATTLLDVFTSGLKGLAPASGGGTTNFLRADGTWVAPSATPTPGGSTGELQWNDGGTLEGTSGIVTNGTYLQFGATAATSGTLRFGNDVFLVGIKAVGGADVGLLGIGADDATYTGDLNTTAHYIRSGGSVVIRSDGDNANAFLMKKTGLAIATVASTGTVIPAFKVTDAAHTALTASTERHSVHFDLSQIRTWATGAITSQRSMRIQAGTIAFAGASVVSTAATLAVSGAPTAGTNATITNALALWVEAGGVGYGTGAIALAGLHRTGHGVEFWRATKNAGAGNEVSLFRFGSVTTDILTIGAGGASGIAGIDYRVASGAVHAFTVNATVALEISATAIDCKTLGITNVASINGQTFCFALAGTNLTDADQTLTVAGGNRYVSSVTLTSNRIKTLGVTGSPTFGEVIRIERTETSAFSITVKDHNANTLYVFPSGVRRAADFRYNGTAFELSGHLALAA